MVMNGSNYDARNTGPETQAKPELVSLVADVAREECRRLYERRLAGLEEELGAVYKTIEEYTHRISTRDK
jgi:hypothetical protein